MVRLRFMFYNIFGVRVIDCDVWDGIFGGGLGGVRWLTFFLFDVDKCGSSCQGLVGQIYPWLRIYWYEGGFVHGKFTAEVTDQCSV